ncbi:MAG: OmpA family protein [Prevotella sp.]|nr:OmpA family protein [Prevotella sp.]
MRRTLFLAAITLFAASTVKAQDCCKNGGQLKSWSYVEAQGGVQFTGDKDVSFTKLLMPQGALSFGHYFTPVVGARLHVEGLQGKGRFDDLDKNYKWNYITTDADLLVNISNLFSKNYARPLNLIFVGGIGLANAWNNDELTGIVEGDPTLAPLAWGKNNYLTHNLRAGLRLETNVTKPFGVSLEVDANNMDDRFNSKTNDKDDWMFSAKLGLIWRFGYKKQCCEKAPEPKAVPIPPVKEPVVVAPPVEKKPEPKAVVKTEKLHESVFYVICKSDPLPAGKNELQRVADFLKKHADAKVQIVGYADKGTGNARVNKMYAERRAAQCKDALVKQFGCDANRIVIDSKGDTVQPFTENDKNRCVIIDSEAQYTVYE